MFFAAKFADVRI